MHTLFSGARPLLMKLMKWALFALALHCHISIVSAQELSKLAPTVQDATKQTITQLLTVQAEAWNAGNLEKFMETYWKSDKLTFSSGGNTTRGWQATLDRYKKNYSTREKMGVLHFDELDVTIIESQTALVLGNWHLRFADGNKADGNFSLVVTKIDNAWKIIHDHSSIVKDPKSNEPK